MRAPLFRHLRWVASPVRSPLIRAWGRAHSLHHVLSISVPSTPQLRCFSASVRSRIFQDSDSTIYALSTAPGRAAIAVVRVSGPACIAVSQTAIFTKGIGVTTNIFFFRVFKGLQSTMP
ncbi:hypothetical protein BDW74DRAFT_108748 [Aspergillus multicolor]|uniref:uncharacterized protein n=1 Tax=Aspergillus multicolor TaxID=41759 RepID=UPI003CCCF04D